MTWKVTYRNSSGNISLEIIESVDRKELFRLLSEKKITPVKIETYDGTDAHHRGNRTLTKIAYYPLTVVLLLLIGWGIRELLKNDNTDHVSPIKTKPKAHIATVNPTIKDISQPTNQIVSVPVVKKDRPTKVGEIVNNYIKLPSGRIHHIRGERTNTNSHVKQDWFRVFNHNTDNEIALIMTLEPGETVVGTPIYRGGFKNAFLESLDDPIYIDPDDTQEIKDLKKTVVAARNELKAAMERGEDIDEIMYDSRNQFQDLATYKQSLERELRSELKGVESEKDFDDLIEAANKLLAKKGIAPTALNSLSRLKLKFMLNKKKGNEK